MKVFVTGATGFIGSQTVRLLANAGHELVCLVWEKEAANPPKPLIDLGAELIIGDVTDKASLLDGMRGCDAVVHLAGWYTLWEADRSIYTKINVDGTRMVMEAALETGVSKAIDISTYAVWGGTPDAPFTEKSPVVGQASSEYARTKHLGEMEAWKLYEKGLPLVVIYPCNVMGPGDTRPTGSYLRNLIERRLPAVMLEETILTYVHVRDVALAILRALEKSGNTGEKYIIGKEIMKTGEVNRMIAQYAGIELPSLALPDSLAVVTAALLTGIANLTKHPPLWGMSTDQARSLKQGLAACGRKAEQELGIRYTPVCEAVEESIAWYRAQKN